MLYPDLKEIKNLHSKLALNNLIFERVYIHSEIIQKIALQLIKNNSLVINLNLVIAGTLLHDIGAYEFFNIDPFDERKYIRHGIIGYSILKNEGYPEDLCRIASHHTGLGLKKTEIIKNNLPLPKKNFLAETIEEEIIMYSDKFHSKHPRFNSYNSYKKKAGSFGRSKEKMFELFRKKFGAPELKTLADQYKMPIV